MSSDARMVAIRLAIERIALRAIDRGLSATEIIARLSAAADKLPKRDGSPREAAAAARRRRREEMMDELERLEAEGRGREAPGLVARKFARDRADPVEIESLTRQLRRWRSREIRTLSGCPPRNSIKSGS